MNKKKVIFLDRDGVINIDKHYLYKIEDFEFTNKLFETCSYFVSLGYEIAVITNQSGIARGYFSIEDFNKLTTWMIEQFKKNNINILDVQFCPHGPNDNCNCRKPKAGMIEEICKKYEIDLNKSWLIGDKTSDIQAGLNAGISNNILITSEYIDSSKDLKTKNIVKNIYETKNIIKE